MMSESPIHKRNLRDRIVAMGYSDHVAAIDKILCISNLREDTSSTNDAKAGFPTRGSPKVTIYGSSP
jgi:hypothetical protein